MSTDEVLPGGDLLVVGVDYYIKLTDGKRVIARYLGRREIKGYGSYRTCSRYDFTNKTSGRNVTVKSKAKILRPV